MEVPFVCRGAFGELAAGIPDAIDDFFGAAVVGVGRVLALAFLFLLKRGDEPVPAAVGELSSTGAAVFGDGGGRLFFAFLLERGDVGCFSGLDVGEDCGVEVLVPVVTSECRIFVFAPVCHARDVAEVIVVFGRGGFEEVTVGVPDAVNELFKASASVFGDGVEGLSLGIISLRMKTMKENQQ